MGSGLGTLHAGTVCPLWTELREKAKKGAIKPNAQYFKNRLYDLQ